MNLLCVLARVPQPGCGKSRLRAHLGDAATDELAGAFAADVLSWGERAADALLVCHRGPAELLPPGNAQRLVVPQVEGDLGERIAAAVDTGFGLGAQRVVIIGSDCPTLPAPLLHQAFAALDGAASTLVPAADGGWIAMGLDRRVRSSLAGVTWSSPHTGRDTMAALSAAGRPPTVLDPWYDIDEPADLDRVRADEGARARAPRTWAALAGLPVTVG